MINPTDMFGQEYQVGVRILHSELQGKSPRLVQRTVIKIEDGKVYLNERNVALKFPNRCFILPAELSLLD